MRFCGEYPRGANGDRGRRSEASHGIVGNGGVDDFQLPTALGFLRIPLHYPPHEFTLS